MTDGAVNEQNTEQPRGYARVRHKLLRRMIRHPLVAVASHWTFQSLLYMDRTERRFKLLLDGVLTLGIGRLLRRWSPVTRWSGAFLAAHSVNFLLNGHLWGILKHHRLVAYTYQDYVRYYEGLAARIEREPSLRYAAVYGSLARSAWKPSSDLDIRLVRNTGWNNGLRACIFALRERTRALLHGFALDLYVLDSFAALKTMGLDEGPTVVLDRASDTKQ